MTFFPDVRAHVFVKARVAAARAEARLERLAGGVGLRVIAHGAEVHLDALFRLAHAHAGAGQLRADQTAAVEDAVGVHELREHLVIAETVLQRHDRRLRPDAGHGVGHDVLRLRGLDHEDDHIHRADVARGRARVKAREYLFALRRAEDQPVGCDLIHVRLVFVDEPELGAAPCAGRRQRRCRQRRSRSLRFSCGCLLSKLPAGWCPAGSEKLG